MLKRYHQGGNTFPLSQPSCIVDSTFKSDTIDTTTDTEIDNWIYGIIGTEKVNVRDLLTLWQNEKKRPHKE
jgi:hypothetical protein